MVFILFFQGDQLRTRVRKICEGFRATLYQCPEMASERHEMTRAVQKRIVDLESVLQTTEQHSVNQLSEVAKELEKWETKVMAIHHRYSPSPSYSCPSFICLQVYSLIWCGQNIGTHNGCICVV